MPFGGSSCASITNKSGSASIFAIPIPRSDSITEHTIFCRRLCSASPSASDPHPPHSKSLLLHAPLSGLGKLCGKNAAARGELTRHVSRAPCGCLAPCAASLWKGSLVLTSEACRSRRDIIGISRLLPDRMVSLVCPPAAYVEERQHRLGRRSLRACDLSDHRHAPPLSIRVRG